MCENRMNECCGRYWQTYLGSPLPRLVPAGWRIVWFFTISTTHLVFSSFSVDQTIHSVTNRAIKPSRSAASVPLSVWLALLWFNTNPAELEVDLAQLSDIGLPVLMCCYWCCDLHLSTCFSHCYTFSHYEWMQASDVVCVILTFESDLMSWCDTDSQFSSIIESH